MRLHLFSSPGEGDIQAILRASAPYLSARPDPLLAYLPAASLQGDWLDYTRGAFAGLATVDLLDVNRLTPAGLAERLDHATALYVPGGNTYYLFQRLHRLGLMEPLARAARAGLPLIAFSAGAILCGADVLTSNDLNCCACTTFAGLGLIPYNILPHYPADLAQRADLDAAVAEYHVFHSTPVLALADGAVLRVQGSALELAHGPAWLLQAGQARHRLPLGPLPAP